MAEDYERLIVLLEGRIDQFDKAMQAAEKRGTVTYQALQKNAFKATTAVEQQLIASAKAQGRALDSVFGQQIERANKSAKASADFFREIERGRDKINQLRAALDPAFASQLRYEQAVEELNDALRRNIITETEHRQVLDQVAAAYLRGGQAAGAHTGILGRLGTMSDGTKAKLQNAGYQVQDVAVMMMSGTDAARALGMQLPQLLSGFGLMGVILGTLTAVGLPLLVNWLSGGEEAARSFDTVLGDVRNSLSAMNEQAAIYTAEGLVALKEKYGEVNAELLAFIELQTEAARIDALQATRESMAALEEQLSGWNTDVWQGLTDLFDGMADDTNAMAHALERARTAANFNDQLAAVSELRERIIAAAGGVENLTQEQYKFYRQVLQSEDALRQLVKIPPQSNWLAGMISEAEALAAKLWEGVRAKAALAGEAAKPGMTAGNADWAKNDLGFTLPGNELIYTPPKTKGGRGGGGGGGGGRSNSIDGLIRDLQTEREIIDAWHSESLDLLNAATEAELAAVGGRHEALERLELEHQERLKGIKEESQTGMLAMTASFLGGIAELAGAFGGKAQKVARVAAAVEAAINVGRAQAQVLADPRLSFWQKFPAMAAVGAAGARVIAAIKGGGVATGGGGGGGGGGTSAGDSSGKGDDKGPLRATLEPLDPNALFTGAAVRKLYDSLMAEAGDRGLIFGWRA